MLHVTDPDDPDTTYVFCVNDPLYEDEPFHLIGPCPTCNAPVPVTEIRNLADLATHLNHEPEPLPTNGQIPGSYSYLFASHTAHHDHCRFGDIR
ncbi:hypothetical protein ABZ746_35095 [Streptomyces sp. NPDC020096]